MTACLETGPHCHDRVARVADRFEVDARGRLPRHIVVTWHTDVGVLARVKSVRATGATAVGGEPERRESVCPGSGRPSREEKERRAAAKAQTLTARAAAARDEAAVALDAFEDGRSEFSDRMLEFREFALHAYARRFKIRRKIRMPWRWEKYGNPEWRSTPRSRGDVYCIFCGEILLRNVAKSSLGNERPLPWPHLTRCMLGFLSGLRDPVPPGTKVLPEEFRQDDRP